MTAALPSRLPEDGRFPFGHENGPRPIRLSVSGTNRQVIVGIYPSALHVDWTAPRHIPTPEGAKGRVRALAIDVEPTVFWDGHGADELIAQWALEVGFVSGDEPGSHGHLSSTTNGPSGSSLVDHYFAALPFTEMETAFLDVYPVFFVKQGARGTPGRPGVRGQADVMDSEYNSISQSLPGCTRATLPLRASADRLPKLAALRFGTWLAEALVDMQPDHIVTLGEEVCSALQLLPHVTVDATFESLSATRQSGYGNTRSLAIGGREIPWTPLAHPGLIRQANSGPGTWGGIHETWLDNRR
jgi:hypothetical protein